MLSSAYLVQKKWQSSRKNQEGSQVDPPMDCLSNNKEKYFFLWLCIQISIHRFFIYINLYESS